MTDVADFRKLRTLCVGGAVIDVIVQIDSDRIEEMTMRNAEVSFLLVETGRKVTAKSISEHIGGGAVNTAVAMSRLGHHAAIIVKLGHDLNATEVVNRLSDEGVDTSHVLHGAPLATGSSVLISSHERNAAIFTYRGANTLLRPDDLDDEAFERDLVYVASLSDESADCFGTILSKAKHHGAMTAANPGIRQLTHRSPAFFGSLPDLDILLLNHREAEQLVPQLIGRGLGEHGVLTSSEAGEHSLVTRGLHRGGFTMPLSGFVQAMTSLGPKCVLLTNGGEGAYACTREAIWHCPVAHVEIAGTAGAGDAFGATFSSMFAAGETVAQALKAATLNAAAAITQVDTQSGLLDPASLSDWFARYDRELKLTAWDFAG